MVLFSSLAQAAEVPNLKAPQALKVEPPSWWAGHSLNPVRLMIRGRNLHGARMESSDSDIKLGEAQINAAGTYIFVNAQINPGAVPGKRKLKIINDSGQAVISFELLKPLPRAGRFQGFSQDDVIYLIMLDRFANGDSANDNPMNARGMVDRTKSRYYHGGDLQGIIDRLPYLKDLGVTALWLTPVYANFNELYPIPHWSPEHYTDYHGYGPVDYYALDPHFGDLSKLRELTDRAHALGIKIILDQVANHTGPKHSWVADPPTPTWFHGTLEKHLDNTFRKWSLADPYATPEFLKPVMEGWYFNILPDLNQDDPELSRYLTQNMLWWIGTTGLDGFRQDTLYFAPRAFWKDCLAAIKREYPSFRVLGEAYGSDPALVSYFQGGRKGFDGIDTGFDAVYDFPLMNAIRDVFIGGKPMEELPASLSRDHLYPNPQMLVTLFASHDEPRFMSLPGATPEALKLAFAFLFTMRGIPLIYCGDEIAMQGGKDPDNRRDFPGGWNTDPRDAFSSKGRTPEEQDVFAHVRRLARLRAELEPLRRGRLAHLALNESVYAYARVSDSGWAIVALNNSLKSHKMEFSPGSVPLPSSKAVFKDRLESSAVARWEEGRMSLELPAHSAVLFASP